MVQETVANDEHVLVNDASNLALSGSVDSAAAAHVNEESEEASDVIRGEDIICGTEQSSPDGVAAHEEVGETTSGLRMTQSLSLEYSADEPVLRSVQSSL